jgi:hypothetical protein
MSTIRLGCVVEGKGEEQAVPLLVRRIAEQIDPQLYVEIPQPIRIHRQRIAERFDDLRARIELAARSLRPPRALLVLFDAEQDCPAHLAPALLQRARAYRADIPIGVVLANHMYEAWFLAAAESLQGKRSLPDDLEPPQDPEAVENPKKWLERKMPRNRKYSETADQPALTAAFDLGLARQRSPSFDKCYREIERLLAEANPPDSSP